MSSINRNNIDSPVAIEFAENLYSFRKFEPIYEFIVQPKTPDEKALAAIEAKLIDANQKFMAREYQAAVTSYQEAQALIYSQLNPRFPPGRFVDFLYPQGPKIFDSLLSLSLEYMNVLPVQSPVDFVRPRVPLDATAVGSAAGIEKLGLQSKMLAGASALDTISDLQLAKRMREAGNTKAADFFANRARNTDPNAFQIFEQPTAPTGGPNPAAGTVGNLTQPSGLNLASLEFAPVRRAVFTPPVRTDLPKNATVERTLGLMVNNKTFTFTWNAGDAPPIDQLKTSIYAARVQTKTLADLLSIVRLAPSVAIDLPHSYSYEIPLGLAECYHALGDWTRAETYYFQTASYQFLNPAIEAPYLWLRLAMLYLDWGNTLFRVGDAPSALPIYSRVIQPNGTVPNTTLYSTASLASGANVAKQVIQNLGHVTALAVNPAIAAAIVEVNQQILKINGGLDYWGFWAPTIPIYSFEYLQSVAINFAQLAIETNGRDQSVEHAAPNPCRHLGPIVIKDRHNR